MVGFRTHARTHAQTHAQTHARTHTLQKGSFTAIGVQEILTEALCCISLSLQILMMKVAITLSPLFGLAAPVSADKRRQQIVIFLFDDVFWQIS